VTFGVVFDFRSPARIARLLQHQAERRDILSPSPAGEVLLLCYGFSGNKPGSRIRTIPGLPRDHNREKPRSMARLANGEPSVPSQGTDKRPSTLRTAGVDLQLDWGGEPGAAAGKLDLNLLGKLVCRSGRSPIYPGWPVIDYRGHESATNVASAFPRL